MSFADEADSFDGSLVGRHEQQPLWYRCVRSVDTDLADALGQLYVDREFSPETRAAAKHLITNDSNDVSRRAEHAWHG